MIVFIILTICAAIYSVYKRNYDDETFGYEKAPPYNWLLPLVLI